MNMRDLEIMIQEIRDAFGDMPYPGTEYITNDLEGNDLERKQIREEFSRYENWLDVPRELLLQERDALPLFEPQGFRFYLPAYMLFALEDYEGADMIPESIVHSLTLPDAGTEFYEFVQERLVLFGEGQRKAILNFLEYLELSHAEDFTDVCTGGWCSVTPRRAIESWDKLVAGGIQNT